MKLVKNVTLVFLSVVLIGVACTKSDSSTTTDYVGNWIKRTVFKGDNVSGAFSFVVDSTVYVGGGFDGTNRNSNLFSFDGTTWNQMPDMPTAAIKRNYAMAFAIGAKGYVVGGACKANEGYDGRLNDVWEFDAITKTWNTTAKASLPDLKPGVVGSGSRYSGVGFSINGKGYITCGTTGTRELNDLWEYDQANDKWSQLNDMPSTDRRYAPSVMVYGGEAFIVGGSGSGVQSNEMFAFKPATNTWRRLRNITNTSTESYDDNYNSIIRSNAAAFVIGNKGYLTTGITNSYNNTTWEYDFGTDVWTQKTNFERPSRADAIGFAIRGRGFVGLGSSSTNYFGSMEEFLPSATYDSND